MSVNTATYPRIAELKNISWKPSGGDYAITALTSLANNAGVKGARADLGLGYMREYTAFWKFKFAVAPTAGTTVGVYLIWANASTGAGTGGYDETTAGLVTADYTNILQFQCELLKTCTVYNSTNSMVWYAPLYAKTRYLQPVFYNNATGQAFSATGTDHEFVIIPRAEVYGV